MADLNTVGFRVDAHVAAGLADSSDAGESPDMLPAMGRVTFTPTLNGPTTFLPTSTILPVLKVVCELDTSGNLRPPANGTALPIDPAGNLILISPQSEDLLDQGWFWEAKFEPYAEQGWQAFVIKAITGAPGDVVKLTTAFPTTSPTGTRQVLVWFVDSLAEADTIPSILVGDPVLVVPDMFLYRKAAS